MSLQFEWDAQKEALNRKKHRVSFEEAVTAFEDPRSLTVPDPDHSLEEDRHVLLGVSHRGRLLVVVHTERGGARKATRREGRQYDETRR